MKVVFFHRKPSQRNFSIESLFRLIRGELRMHVTSEVKEMTYFSQGLFKRLYLGLEAMVSQGDVNHVTGDIHFIVPFLRTRKTILTIHDVVFMKHTSAIARLVFQYFWIIFPVRRSRFVTTVSEATKAEVLKYVKVAPEKIRVIYNPISTDFKYDPKPFNKSNPRILQLGTKFNKNVVRLIQALRGIHCTLEIIGELNESLRNELVNSGVNFCTSQNLSDKEIIEKYQAADIVAFVSTYEGFGMPIVEANAIGRVVLTSNVASMPEIARDAAHIVDPFSVESIRAGILKVITDDSYRETLIANGLMNRKRFDVKTIAGQYLQVYKEVSEQPWS